jgi:DNA helicase HerA-like ATPase
VLNLQGLATPDQQQAFVAHLATTLFSWIKAHPSPPGRSLRGLLVIDEAKDLVPSSKKTASGESLIRLANQARKYGLGLVLATQAPRSIDHNVIANCTTQLYGRAASPAALEVIREQLRARGAQGDDVAALTKGCFYAHSEGFAAPVKIRTRLSLSYHPGNPLDETGILERAARVRPSTFIEG